MADHFNLFFMLDGPLIQGATSGIFYGVNLVDETQVSKLYWKQEANFRAVFLKRQFLTHCFTRPY
jgi:hypothetical protein